jgi:outer membrane protein TolC
MKKRVILSLIIILTLLCYNTIYAEEDTSLDVEKVAAKVIKNSAQMKSAETALNNATLNLSAIKGTYSYLNIMKSEYQTNVTQRQRDVVQNSIQFAAYSKYTDVLKAKYALEIQNKILAQAAESYANIKLKYKLKQASMDQLIQSEGQYNSARLEQQIKERELKGLVSSLNALMGEAPTKQYSEYIDKNIISSKEIGTYESYVDSASVNRAEILNINDQIALRVQERNFSYGSNLFENNPRHIQIMYDIDILNTQIETTNVDIQLELLDLYNNLKAAMTALESAQDTMIEAEKDLKAVELKYQMGMISRFDKQEEELTYMKVKYDLQKAQLDAWLAQTYMYLASGLGLQI